MWASSGLLHTRSGHHGHLLGDRPHESDEFTVNGGDHGVDAFSPGGHFQEAFARPVEANAAAAREWIRAGAT